MNAAHFQLVSFDGLPWPLIGAVLLLTPVLMRLPGILLALGVLVRGRSHAQLRRVVAERITAAAPEADDLVKMLGAVMDGSPPAAGQPAEDVPVARPGPPAVPPPREEPPPRE